MAIKAEEMPPFAAVSSSVAVSVGGKAMLLQNNKQLINSDSGVKVEAVESFSNILARMLGGSVEGIENKPSSISGNIFSTVISFQLDNVSNLIVV